MRTTYFRSGSKKTFQNVRKQSYSLLPILIPVKDKLTFDNSGIVLSLAQLLIVEDLI